MKMISFPDESDYDMIVLPVVGFILHNVAIYISCHKTFGESFSHI